MVGQYIWLDGEWRYIGNYISPTEIEVNAPVDIGGSWIAHTATLNRLTITSAADASIDRLEVECKAEVR
jgi:hypothetical protein